MCENAYEKRNLGNEFFVNILEHFLKYPRDSQKDPSTKLRHGCHGTCLSASPTS